MSIRYVKNKVLVTNTTEDSLRELLENRAVDSIKHYSTTELKYPNIENIKTFQITKHTWKFEDRYWKLSNEYYGDPKYWWVIALFNKKPIEAMLKAGDTISIPQPLSDVLGAIA